MRAVTLIQREYTRVGLVPGEGDEWVLDRRNDDKLPLGPYQKGEGRQFAKQLNEMLIAQELPLLVDVIEDIDGPFWAVDKTGKPVCTGPVHYIGAFPPNPLTGFSNL